MEFKDKLKALRQERGLTQAQLAEAIFVSRSTVAKWENGLGLPNPESLKLLEEYFCISQADMATTEPEAVIVQKNRKLHLTFQIISWTTVIAVMILIWLLPFAILEGNYGLTADMAAGVFADSPYIDTGDYRIYYSSFEGDWEDGRHWTSLSTFKPVQKHFWGFTVSEEDYESDLILHNNYVVGRLYSIEGKYGYYNVIKNTIGNEVQDYLLTAETITIAGESYEVQCGFYFVTPEPVEYFKIGDVFLNVE